MVVIGLSLKLKSLSLNIKQKSKVIALNSTLTPNKVIEKMLKMTHVALNGKELF